MVICSLTLPLNTCASWHIGTWRFAVNCDKCACQGRAQVVHYLHQEIDEKRRQMQQQLDLRDRQLIEASRAKADQLVPSLCDTWMLLKCDVSEYDAKSQKCQESIMLRENSAWWTWFWGSFVTENYYNIFNDSFSLCCKFTRQYQKSTTWRWVNIWPFLVKNSFSTWNKKLSYCDMLCPLKSCQLWHSYTKNPIRKGLQKMNDFEGHYQNCCYSKGHRSLPVNGLVKTSLSCTVLEISAPL